jgi:ATP-dependent Zn protease
VAFAIFLPSRHHPSAQKTRANTARSTRRPHSCAGSFFKKQVEAGNVEAVSSVGDSIEGSFKTAVTYPIPMSQPPPANAPVSPPSDQLKPRTSMRFKTQRPTFAEPGLETLLEEKGVVIEAVDESGSSWFKLLVGFGPTLLLVAAFVWLSRRAAAAGGGLFGLGRSRAKRYSEEQPKATFDDAAGIDEAELRNLVNEAALLAARKDASAVGAEDFGEAMQTTTGAENDLQQVTEIARHHGVALGDE